MLGLPKKVIIKIKKVYRGKGDAIFWVMWDFIVDGKKHRARHETQFPFSMS